MTEKEGGGVEDKEKDNPNKRRKIEERERRTKIKMGERSQKRKGRKDVVREKKEREDLESGTRLIGLMKAYGISEKNRVI